LELLDEVFSNRPDLTDKPVHNPDLVLYIDGSSYMENRKKMAGYAVVSEIQTCGMLLLLYMSTEPYTRKEDSLQQEGKGSKPKSKS